MTCDTWHVTRDKWYVICDLLHMTCDMWHVTRDMSHVVGVNILSKFQLPSSYCLWFMMFYDLEEKADWITHKGVYRTQYIE